MGKLLIRGLALYAALSLLQAQAAQAVAAATAQPQAYSLCTHYAAPPFVTGKGRGLTFDFAALLNRHLGPRYRFSVEPFPRKRLEAPRLTPQQRCIVPWVSPVWFDDEARQRYAWSNPLLRDADLVLSAADRPVDFRGPESLLGKTLGGVLGHRYADVEPLVLQGRVRREDVNDEQANLHKLAMHRVDVAFLPESSHAYYRIHQPDLVRPLVVAPRKRGEYLRHVFALPEHRALIEAIDTVLASEPGRAEWRALLQGYGLRRADE